MSLRERLTRRVLSESQLEGTPFQLLGKLMDKLGNLAYETKQIVSSLYEGMKEDDGRIKKGEY